jgi:hypothetical protein
MYRPTVRYDDVFQEYINSLFHATHLDRNQLLRAALFTAAHSNEFQALLKRHQKRDVSLPFPRWKLDQDRYWMEQCPGIEGEGGDVNVSERKREAAEVPRFGSGGANEQTDIRRIGPGEGRTRAIPTERIKVSGDGISFTLN